MRRFVFVLLLLSSTNVVMAGKIRMYVGTYTHGASEGIYTCVFDSNSGEISEPVLAAKTVNPSFLAISPSGKFVYAVNETVDFEGSKSGACSAFAIQSDGGLKFLNQLATGGGAPCHMVLDKTGKHVLIANYVGGNACVLSTDTNGALVRQTSLVQHAGTGPNTKRQDSPHAHSINLDSSNQYAVVADLGTDKIMRYKFDATKGTLTSAGETIITAGSGPRHLAFHPTEKYAYVINELVGTVTAMTYDKSTGALVPFQTIPTTGTGTAEILVHPSGKFVYGSNRGGHNTIAAYLVNDQSGALTSIGVWSSGGREPRNFRIAPNGKFLLAENQNSDSIHVFRIDPSTGKLSPTQNSVNIPNPVCIRFAK